MASMVPGSLRQWGEGRRQIQIDKEGTRDVSAVESLGVVDIEVLGVALGLVDAGVVNVVLLVDGLPELSTDLNVA